MATVASICLFERPPERCGQGLPGGLGAINVKKMNRCHTKSPITGFSSSGNINETINEEYTSNTQSPVVFSSSESCEMRYSKLQAAIIPRSRPTLKNYLKRSPTKFQRFCILDAFGHGLDLLFMDLQSSCFHSNSPMHAHLHHKIRSLDMNIGLLWCSDISDVSNLNSR